MEQKAIRCIAVKYFLYLLLAVILFTVQERTALMLFGAKGMPVIALFIAVALVEDEFGGALIGLFAGILCDGASALIFGVASGIFLVLGCAAGLLAMYMVNACARSTALLSGAAAALYGLLVHYFLYGIWDYDGSAILLLTDTLPMVILTTAWGAVLYLLVRAVRDTAESRLLG